MDYNEVRILEERWTASQHARPIQQVRTLPLQDLILAPEVFQGRMVNVSGDQQEDHTRDLVKGIKNAKTHLESMTVFWIDGGYYIIDGHHRHAAYCRCKHDLPELMMDIPVNEFTGSFYEAKVLSTAANTKNKLVMSVTEKRQLAWEYLNLGKEYYGTLKTIIAITGVTKNTVGKYKKLCDQYISEGLDPKQYTLQDVIYSAREQVDYNDDWKDAQSQAQAHKLRQALGPIGRSQPEITAKALMLYLGEALAERVLEDMAYYLEIPLQLDEDGALVKYDEVPF